MNRRAVGRDQPDLWDRLIAGALEHETAIASAVAKEAKIERRRNGRSNWTGDRQTLAEIRSLVQLRHKGPCDTDDGEVYLRAALPWIAAKAGGIEAEGALDRVAEWAAAVTPRISLDTIRDCMADAEERNGRGRLWWSASDLGNLLRLTTTERERLSVTRIRPAGMSGRQFADYQRAREAQRAKAKRIAAGARPREQSKAQLAPWDALNMSRATYFRRQKEGTLPAQIRDRETVSSVAGTKYLQPGTVQSHALEPTVQGPASGPRLRQGVGADGHSPGAKVRAVPAGRAVALPLPAGGVSEHPDMLGGGEWKQLGDVVATYVGGPVPEILARAVRDARLVRHATQATVARHVGVSRPQLANALQGRFGLSRSAAANLLAWLAA